MIILRYIPPGIILLILAAVEGVDVDIHSHVNINLNSVDGICNMTSAVVNKGGTCNVIDGCCCDDILEELNVLKQLVNRTGRDAEHPRDCMDYLNRGHTDSGIYTVMVSSAVVDVYCDMETDGGGWMVFQRRASGNLENFDRGWFAYRDGFGDLNSSCWWGNKYLSLAFRDGRQYELRVDMTDWNGIHKYAKYGQFHVGEPIDKYPLTVIEYQGTAGDSLSHVNGQQFSTFDQDNDAHSTNCADVYNGGFWFKGCHFANPNGPYSTTSAVPYAQGVIWYHFHDSYYYSLKEVEMKFRAVME